MDDKELLTKIFENTPVKNQDYFLDKCSESESVPMTMLFAREAWKGVLASNQNEWIDASINSLKGRIGRDDLYSKAFLPEKPDLLSALEHIKESSVDESAVSYVVREAQKDLLYWIFSILDGGHCFSDGLDSNWALFELDEDLTPKRQLMMFQGTSHEFDPSPEE